MRGKVNKEGIFIIVLDYAFEKGELMIDVRRNKYIQKVKEEALS